MYHAMIPYASKMSHPAILDIKSPRAIMRCMEKRHNNIKQLRNKNRLSQDALADLMHVSRQTIMRWENKESPFDIDDLDKLADKLGCTIIDLLKPQGAPLAKDVSRRAFHLVQEMISKRKDIPANVVDAFHDSLLDAISKEYQQDGKITVSPSYAETLLDTILQGNGLKMSGTRS